jgi:circadian clock protein KaiC
VIPITSMELQHPALEERISSGVPALDTMLGGQGYFRGTSILVSGTAGAGKSSMAATFAHAAASRAERCLYFAFEESPQQIMRNMRSIGLDLERYVRRGLLRFQAVRPNHYGLEMHLAVMLRSVEGFQPQVVVVDPITNLLNSGAESEVRSTLTRLIDFLKANAITALFTSLTSDGAHLEHTEVGVSSLVDAWLVLRDIEISGERNRGLYLLKSRGMAHSNQLREFRLTDRGIELVEVYVGAGGVLTGAARAAQEAQERAHALQQQQAAERQRRTVERKREALEAQIAALRAEFDAETEEARRLLGEVEQRTGVAASDRADMARLRWADGHAAARPATRAARPRPRAKNNGEAR